MRQFSAVRAASAVLAVSASVFYTSAVYASASVSAQQDDPYFTVGAPIVEEVTGDTLGSLSLPEMPTADEPGLGDAVDEADMILDKIINMGKKIWAIIEANRPVVNIKTDIANALPEGANSWLSLQGWQVPTSKVYRVRYVNGFGMDVVNFAFRVLFTHGGNVNGKGLYLTHVTIVPASLSVAWGYTFNAEGSAPSVMNAGSHSQPMGAMELLMKWSVDTVVKHMESSSSFYVRGDGLFVNLSDGNT